MKPPKPSRSQLERLRSVLCQYEPFLPQGKFHDIEVELSIPVAATRKGVIRPPASGGAVAEVSG